MGEKDLDRIHPVYRYAQELSYKNYWGFKFTEDTGHHENAMMIFDDGTIVRPPVRGAQGEIFEPDIAEFNEHIIIEFEEEAGPGTGYFGAKLNKGHTEYTNTRDTRRDKYYTKVAKPPFRLFKVWESNPNWKQDLEKFLNKCYQERKK